MDDLKEMFTLPTWLEVNTMSKFPWDCHSGTLGHSHYASPTDLMAVSHLSQQQALCETLANSMHSASRVNCFSSDVSSGSPFPPGMHEAVTFDVLRRLQEGSCNLGKSTSLPISSSCDMAYSSVNELRALTTTLSQPYMEGIPSPTLGLGPAPKVEPFMLPDGPPNSAHLYERTPADKAQIRPNEGAFVPICGPQAQHLRTTSSQQVSHGLSATPYATHTGLGQPQGAAAGTGSTGAARPRVRARRGQATDPHSIAERNRRERIADRMKALQELVPNANKTDKASMLDEIIEYVRFLQLQVKILSMSRLSGTGAMVPLVAGIPSEGPFDFAATTLLREGSAVCSSQDDIIAIEQQVAQLMEESMGSALQFLQSKGLCLMPTTMATSMSSSNTRPMTNSSRGKNDATSASIRPSSNVVISLTSLTTTGDLIANEVSSGIQSSRETLTQPIVAASFKCGLKPSTNMN
ncbi:hypothetical protein GOP47_0007178 [Adiantum capillus-veneris]|uniref:BHLH domain-containing protein n=1 Tax=Adiantum capillus-veneris TaxID=13818 RepID=A0A9D4V0E7_ADICA|nr:hypothetical protein GOP47_0007178 [Adiantum capillus-veneris]